MGQTQSGNAGDDAWPAVALVGSCELLMMIIRGTWQATGYVSPEKEQVVVGMPDALQVQAVEEFGGDVTTGRLPSIRARLHVGQPRARSVREHLATLVATQEIAGTKSVLS